MKIKIIWLIIAGIFLLSSCAKEYKDYTQYVNPFIGTGGDGHTYPGASVPFGMVQLSPDTRTEGQESCGGYYYPDSIILGFSHTHLNGVGEPEYRDILFIPSVGEVTHSKFKHENELAEPGYYSVFLEDSNIKAELTTTARCGFHKYTFPKTDSANIIIDLLHPDGAEEGYIKIVNDNEIEGLRRSHGWAYDQYVYIVAQFSKPFSKSDVFYLESENQIVGKNLKTCIKYKTIDNEEILVKVGISSVSAEGARKNLNAEISGWNFNKIRSDAKELWNEKLNKIQIDGGTEDLPAEQAGQRINFYTSMYHAFLSPDLFMDVDGSYRGIDGKIHKADSFTNYTVFSLWDTFRGLHPLFTIIEQKETNEFIKSLLAKYDDGGRLPMWPLVGNYTDDMLGYHVVSIIADAYIKGIRDYNIEKAYTGMKEISQMDRLGLKYYKNHGYIPYDRQGESVSKTLEYCYNDWCISQIAKALGKEDDYDEYNVRSHFYENVFDTAAKFMRGKSYDRKWLSPFDPLINSAYSEGNAYQYMFVPHDTKSLIDLAGGDEEFSKWLDILFTYQTDEEQQGIIGQYWHGNEPGHHLPYLYNYVGKPWKTQEIVHKILTELYSDDPEGIAGNEDCGQMSAWYILSSLGFYPVSPGQYIYVFGSPLFDKATINLENLPDGKAGGKAGGKEFIIEARNRSEENYYIQSVKLNGETYSKSYINHSDIINGGNLIFEMGDKPNKEWGSSGDNRPPSGNGPSVVSLPYVKSGKTLFMNSTKIELACDTKNSMIRYTLDGTKPSKKSKLCTSSLEILRTTTLKFQAFDNENLPSGIVTTQLTKAEFNDPIKNIEVIPGLNYKYFEKFFVTTADLDIVEPILQGVVNTFNIEKANTDKYFGFKYDGYIKVPNDGIYTFYLESNDGSRLYIDGEEIIENDANHGMITETCSIALKAGFHKIDLKYFQAGGGKGLKVSWQGPRFGKREIKTNELYREKNN
ncbi:MAG: GH92 family glycosyl hydrolase [Bacteroidota bacterium]